jgi:hypothetical protein
MRHDQMQDRRTVGACQLFSLFATRQPEKHNRVRHGQASDTIIAGTQHRAGRGSADL